MNNSITQKPAGSRYSTMSLVQVAIFGAIICIMAFTPFWAISRCRLQEQRSSTSCHYRFTADGTEKGRCTWLLFGLTSFINKHDQSYGYVVCIHPILHCRRVQRPA